MTLAELVALSLAEDIGPGDVTTRLVVDDRAGAARIVAKEALVVCGHAPAAEAFAQVGARYAVEIPEGSAAAPGQLVARIEGPLAALLTGERTALNFLMRLSGIATHTRSVIAAAGGMRVLDTRKTTPLHRALEKHAVRCGGGGNHRFGLFDGVLIKDNHIAAAGGIAEAMRRARGGAHPLLRIEIEIESLGQLAEALDAGADVVMLDNMDDALLVEAVRFTAGRARLEASGNMTAERVARLAGIGIDWVSMGGLVHQARWADLSMRIV